MARGDDKIVQEAKERHRHGMEHESTARANWLEDVKFANGDDINGWQWPSEVMDNRSERPCLTVNKVRQHVLQVVNDARQNKAAIKITATGDGATYEAAQIYTGLCRHIEYHSNATAAYDKASWDQVQGGIGYVRATTRYVDSSSMDQEIKIARVPDALAVLLDPDIQEYDGSDAKWGFIGTKVLTEDAERRYPAIRGKRSKADFGVGADPSWHGRDYTLEMEYYRIKDQADRLHVLPDGGLMKESEAEDQADRLAPHTLGMTGDDGQPMPPKQALRAISTRDRSITEPVVEWFKIVGDTIVDRKDTVWDAIPICRAVGEETVIEGRLDRKGHVRPMRDAQRMFNYWNPLSLDTPLPTPDGWTTMGKVATGNWLLDEKGKPVQVAGTSPIHIDRDCYRVTFDDGSSIVADGQHPWTVEQRGKRRSANWDWATETVPTSGLTPRKHYIWVTSPLDLPSTDLPIHPYLLGVWLGDGSSAEPRISAGRNDAEDMRRALLDCGLNVGDCRYYPNKNYAADITVHGVRSKFSALKLLGNKHIPPAYLRASYEQRLALLQGMMDTDGSISARLQCSYTTVSPAIAAGLTELLRTLGIKAVSCLKESRLVRLPQGGTAISQVATQFSFSIGPDVPVFRLPRKARVQCGARATHLRRTKRHGIISVVPVPSVPVRCVGINSESHLFLAGESMVPTHNSAGTEAVALQGKSPYIGTSEAFEGKEAAWAVANTENPAYLTYNGINDMGQPIPRPERAPPPVMPQAFIQGMTISDQHMMMVSGQYQAELGRPGNETSGIAIQQRQRQGDTATYHYIDHLAGMIRFVGRLIVAAAPKVYDTPRVLKIMAANGDQSDIHLTPDLPDAHEVQELPGQQAGPTPQGQAPTPQDDAAAKVKTLWNPSIGRYAVQADVGPSFGTMRQEAFNAFTQILAQNKELTSVIGDLALKNADFPGADEAGERLRRMVPPQAMGGPPAQVTELQQQLQMVTQHGSTIAQQADQHIAQMQQQMADMQRRLDDKSADVERGAYDSETRRLAAVGAIDKAALLPVVRELVSQLLGTPALPVIQAHQTEDAMHQQALDRAGQAMQPQMPDAPQLEMVQ